MVAAGTFIEPRHAVTNIGVRSRRRWMVQRALRHHGPLTDRNRGATRRRAAANASLRVLAHLWKGRIGIHRERSVVGLAADVANRKHEIFRDPAVHRQAPLLVSGCEQVWIDTGGGIDRARLRLRWTT